MSVDWDELIPHIAHDARALVRKALTNAQLLERSLTPAPGTEVSEHLRAVIEAQTGLNRLFVRLVALAEASRPRRSPHSKTEILDLETVILGIRLEYRDAIEQAGAELVVPQLPALNVPLKIQSVLRELVENSLHYRDPSRSLRVVISAEADESTVRVRVTDNGTGVPTVYAEKLFHPLERLDPVRSGFGLGLAISRAILTAAGGSISFEPGLEGAGFVFEVPYHANETSA